MISFVNFLVPIYSYSNIQIVQLICFHKKYASNLFWMHANLVEHTQLILNICLPPNIRSEKNNTKHSSNTLLRLVFFFSERMLSICTEILEICDILKFKISSWSFS